MPTVERGSTWKKWDLHVHTPESLVHNYPGEKEAAWEAFLADLEALPAEFKVLGINDYLFVEGYERVLQEKRNGRLANIDLLLPVVELRMDKFGGVLEKGDDGQYTSSPWSRINLHVIFDEVEPALIRQQFIPAISRKYTLVPGVAGQWGGVITRENLISLGEAVIASLPEGRRANAPSPLKAGFNNLNVSYDGLKEALENPLLVGKCLVAIGKSEWETLRWNDNTIADKKTVINEADLVFTAAANPQAYARARAALGDANVNDKLLDCSDAHSLSTSNVKDRVGNCFTWIKADSTFRGLLQAIQEFEDRIYVGDNPPKRLIVEQNKTKFINSIQIAKKDGSTLPEPWFNLEIPLSPDLVAIIGNKGSGKSALSDVLALVGNTRHHEKFSFLKDTRFRNSKTKYAQHFVGTLNWSDGTSSSVDLDKDPAPTSVERVKYLPQSYLEILCNELGEKGSNTFDAELRKIIYSHVPEESKLGKQSMDELLEFKVAEITKARKSLRDDISTLNRSIVDAEQRLAEEFKKGLLEQLSSKRGELASLEASPPQPVEDPNTSAEAVGETKAAAAHLEALEHELTAVGKEEAELKEAKSKAAKQQAVAARVVQAVSNEQARHEAFIKELQQLLDELEVAPTANVLVELKVNSAPVVKISTDAQDSIRLIDEKLQSDAPHSLFRRREHFVESIADAKGKLGERQRLYVQYREELVNWEKSKSEIVGATEKPGTIVWLAEEIASLDTLPAQLADLQARRRQLTRDIHAQLDAMVNEYKRLYEPVQNFVQSAEQMDMQLPLEFHVRVEEMNFEDQFSNRLNRQARGTFSGIEEGGQRLKTMLSEATFVSADDAVAFAERVDTALHYDQRDEHQPKAVRFGDQLRKGGDPVDMLDHIYGLDYLSPRYSLTYAGQEIGQLSPGERGLLLLLFYLLVDKDDTPIIIDQPEENLDNQTIYTILVKCIKKAKERRQVIMVTHNPNLAVVCDAEQIVYAACDKQAARFDYESGSIEHPTIRSRVVQILEGTEPAFKNRQSKYRLA
jgi:ABC-type lipoprotein export system ATPase subunit